MELYGIVGNVERKLTPSGKELLEVSFYSLDFQTEDGKNQRFQIAFWNDIDRNEQLIKKGSRMRIFVDKVKVNSRVDSNGKGVSYFNTNGYAFTYVNTGNNSGGGNESGGNGGGNSSYNRTNNNNTNRQNSTNTTSTQNNASSTKNQSSGGKDQMNDIEDFLSSI